MTTGPMGYQFDEVDAHGVVLQTQAGSLRAEHAAIVRDIVAAGDFWGGAGSTQCQAFIHELGRNFQVIYEALEDHGGKVRTVGSNTQFTDHGVGGSWMMG